MKQKRKLNRYVDSKLFALALIMSPVGGVLGGIIATLILAVLLKTDLNGLSTANWLFVSGVSLASMISTYKIYSRILGFYNYDELDTYLEEKPEIDDDSKTVSQILTKEEILAEEKLVNFNPEKNVLSITGTEISICSKDQAKMLEAMSKLNEAGLKLGIQEQNGPKLTLKDS